MGMAPRKTGRRVKPPTARVEGVMGPPVGTKQPHTQSKSPGAVREDDAPGLDYTTHTRNL